MGVPASLSTLTAILGLDAHHWMAEPGTWQAGVSHSCLSDERECPGHESPSRPRHAQ